MSINPERIHSILTILNIQSEEDSEVAVKCCGTLAVQREISNYELTMNNNTFRIPKVWASVCGNCQQVYFSPEVTEDMMNKIFNKLYPERVSFDIA